MRLVLDGAFRFFFKYSAVVFEQGEFVFAASRSTAMAILAVAAMALAALLTYRSMATLPDRRDRLALVGLRVALVAVLLFCLFRPTLLLRTAVPQQNFLGILFDDSRSMTIADRPDQPRSAFVASEFGPGGATLDALAERFVLRFFRFSSSAARANGATDVTYDGSASRIGPALERAREELAGLPLAGLVLVSDGADTTDLSLDEELSALKARSIPVFTVGVGEERLERDIQVSRVEIPRTILKGTSMAVDVVVSHTGYAGTTVPLLVEDEGRLVASEDIRLPADGEAATTRVTFTAADAGSRLFRFRIPPQDGEQVAQNNARDTLVQVSDRRDRVLYMEGEPRFEVKFIRRAVEDDKNLQVVVLLRTAKEKYWRGDIDSPDELASGFPRTREELFAYRAIILGSVEAAAFSPDQLRMLADFVSVRGGGLIMLGGRRAFAEGGWAGTPVADVLPVDLPDVQAIDYDRTPTSAPRFFTRVSVSPTRSGEAFPVTRLDEDPEASRTRWLDLPALSTVNVLGPPKPGASVLLTGAGEDRSQQVVLAYQRYGRGKALAFPVQDSWIWKMDATIPVEDTTHATFWRRLVRWLVEGVPDYVSLTSVTDRVEPGEPMPLRAEVVDQAFVAVNDGQVIATVTSPTGRTQDVPLEWTVTRDGEYQGTFVPDEPGRYEVRARAARGETALGTSLMYVRASAGDAEYFDAGMRASLLSRVAEDTGGRFFTRSSIASLPEAITVSGRGVTVVEERDLWDMPILLMLILGLIAAEWGFRRLRGLA
jgi:uncharacterized membrane protein